MPEEWRKVDGWPYEVSSLGRVRRCEPASGTRVGNVLKPHLDQAGYVKVLLSNRGERQFCFVHRLVAKAFLGPPKGRNVNHVNGDKSDPRAANLEWVTKSDNQLHAYRTGLQERGEGHGRAKLTEEQVLDIRRRYSEGGVSQEALGREYGVHQTLIGFIVRKVVWTHI